MANGTNVILAFGANEVGAWGGPRDALARSFGALPLSGVVLDRVSSLIVTQPLGPVPQSEFVNAVAAGHTTLNAEALLGLLKRLEHDAGRRQGPRWGPRPLDIDILDFGGMIAGWDAPHDTMRPAHLVLPHPELHKRDFVLGPLAEIAPEWHHPVFGKTAAELLASLVEPLSRSACAGPTGSGCR